MGDPVKVLLAFPGTVGDDLLDRVRAVAPDAEITVHAYEEPHPRRSARGRGELEGAPPAPPLAEDFRAALAEAEVMLAFDLPVDVPTLAPNLRWVQAIGAGVDHYRGSGIEGLTVTNAVGVSAVPMAEFVIGRLLQVWKRFDELADLQRAHEWKPTYGRTVSGSTLGIVGLGAIGSAVSVRARALGMHTLGIRRSYTPGDPPTASDELFGPGSLAEVLSRSDAVVLSAPATAETGDLFDAAAFAAMKPGAIFCNVARGTLVDEAALVDALTSGHLRAAVLDVTREEPLPADSPLWDTPGVLISPHSSTSVDRYMETLYDLFADNLARYLRGEPLRNVVDLAAGY